MSPAVSSAQSSAVSSATTSALADAGPRRVTLEPHGPDIGPLTHLGAERQRLADLEWPRFGVSAVGATIGAEIDGVQLSESLDDEMIGEIRRALLEYKVIFFRDQQLTADQHVGFARRFGDLEVHPFLDANAERPELVRFSKDPRVGGYENGWHSDVSWRECPSMGAVLRAVEVPSSGGDTLFADMAAAYDGLRDEVRERVDGLVAVHDFTQTFGQALSAEERAEKQREHPPVEHPVVRTHPETGRKLLYVNRFFTSHVVGLDPEESADYITLLSRQAETLEYQCRFRWTPNAVAFWDNRAVQHYAASDYWPARRVMERASIIGDRPV